MECHYPYSSNGYLKSRVEILDNLIPTFFTCVNPLGPSPHQRETPGGQARRLLDIRSPGCNQFVNGVKLRPARGETTLKDPVKPHVPQE